MAKQAGPIFIEGTLDDLTFYKMQGEYYVRMKSRLTRKRVLESPRFARTRMHAGQLADASRIASQLYRSIPKEKKDRQIFRAFVGKAKVLLAQGKDKKVVLDILMNELFPQVKRIAPKLIIKKKKEVRVYVSKSVKLRWYSISLAKKTLIRQPEVNRLLNTVSSCQLRC
jgi:hypothetical protein